MKILAIAEAHEDHYTGAEAVLIAAGVEATLKTMRVPREELYEMALEYDLIVAFGKKPLQYIVHKKLPAHKICRRQLTNYDTTLPPICTTLSGKSFYSRFAQQMVRDVQWGVWMSQREPTPLTYREVSLDEMIPGGERDICGFFGFDIETNRLEYWAPDAKILVASVGDREYVLSTQNYADFKYYMSHPFNTLVGHNLKFDYSWWTEHVGEIHTRLFDTEVAHALIDDNVYDNGLGYLSSRLGYHYHKDMVERGTLEEQDPETVKKYNQIDVVTTAHAGQQLRQQLRKKNMEPIFDFIMDVLPAFSRMERRGVYIDQPYLAELEVEYMQKLADMKASFPDGMNPDKPKQVRHWIYEDMELPRLMLTKTGLEAVNKTTLEKLRNTTQYKYFIDQDPLKALLDYRALKKLESTYIKPARELIKHDGRIHANWNLCAGEMGGVKSGRTSCRNPNLQNIPRGSIIRPMFRATPGYYWGSADYSGLEVVVQADLSGDEVMMGMIERGENYHTFTMSDFYDIPVAEIEGILADPSHPDYHDMKEKRSKIKIRNFLIQYGGGAGALSEALGVSKHECQDMIDGWYLTFQGVTAWQNQVEMFTRQHGYAISPTGRRRTLPDINVHGYKQWRARRQACNHPIQSFASDLTLTAIYLLDQLIQREELAAHLLLNVHDEMDWEQKMSDPHVIMDKVEKTMTLDVPKEIERRFGYKMQVPLTIDAAKGERWS